MVSGLCELRQHAKEQMCFGCVILVSDPAGPAAVVAAQLDTPGRPAVLPSAGQERNNQEDLSASNFLQAHTLPSFQGATAGQLISAGVGAETCPTCHLPSQRPILPCSSLWVLLSLL